MSIPFKSRDPQFAAVENWFETQNPPESLLFADHKGVVTLTGVQWRGHRGNAFVLGKLGAEVAFFSEPRRLKRSYKIVRLCSKIDGLQNFTSFRPIAHNTVLEDGIPTTVVTVKPSDKVAFRHGGFTYTIRSDVPWRSTSGVKFSATAGTVLETNTSKGATIEDHVNAQWPIRALLILAHGSELYWRGHQALDDQFPVWMLSGPPQAAAYVPVQYSRTIRDQEQPERSENTYLPPAFHIHDLGSRRLRKWLKIYEDPLLRRAIEPVVEVINGATKFLEPQVLMTVLGLEAMGYYRDPNRRPKVSLENQIMRCVEATQIDWKEIGSKRGISNAIARINNDLKHPDRLRRPTGIELSLTSVLARVIMRLQVIDLLVFPNASRERIKNSMGVTDVINIFKNYQMKITSGGNFVNK